MLSEEPVPYEEALAQAGYGKLQLFVTFAGSMCLLCSYVSVSSISLVLPVSQCDLELTSQTKGWLITSGFAGIILSSYLWGFLSDTLGRRFILIRCLMVDGFLYICTSFVPNIWLFLVLRLFNGFSSCGGVVPAWAYMGEFHTDRYRTRAVMMASIAGCTLFIWLPCLAWLIFPLPIEIQIYKGFVFKSWRLFYMLCGIPSLISSFLMMSLPESPKFLLASGEKQECIRILRYVYVKNTGKPSNELKIQNIMIGNHEKIEKPEGNPNEIRFFFRRMWIQTAPLLKKPLKFNFLILCTLQFMLYFCNNGMLLWEPETVNRIAQYEENNPNEPGTFCQAVQNYRTVLSDISLTTSTEHFNITDIKRFEFILPDEGESTECNDSVDLLVYENSAILGSVTVLGVFLISVLVNYFPRKFVLASFTTAGLVVILLLIFFNKINFISYLVTSLIVCAGSAIPVVTSAVVDHFPTNLRAMAVCLTIMSGRLGTIVSSQVVGNVLDTHCNIILYCFAVLLSFCLFLVTYLPRSSSKLAIRENSLEGEIEETELNRRSIA